MTRQQRAWLAAVLAFLVLAVAADLAAWLRLDRQLRELEQARLARRGSAEGPTGDSPADLAALRRELHEER